MSKIVGIIPNTSEGRYNFKAHWIWYGNFCHTHQGGIGIGQIKASVSFPFLQQNKTEISPNTECDKFSEIKLIYFPITS